MESSARKNTFSTRTSYRLLVGLILATTGHQLFGQTNQSTSQIERNREKAYLRQQFARHFRAIQVLSQEVLKAQEEGTLTSNRLGKEMREINKSARNLRSMIGLGALAEEEELKMVFSAPEDYDEAIRLLGRLIREFARNPSHQNSRILNTDQATEAQTDLLSIIRLSKALAAQARSYQK
ncbi:MAG: hypothetical protein ACKOB4_02890 [Acidobacteriota bacterium]